MRLSLLLLVAVLCADAFAEACGATHPATVFEVSEAAGSASARSVGEELSGAVAQERVGEQDFAEGPDGAACLLRAPRLLRPLSEGIAAFVADCGRREISSGQPLSGRLLRAHRALYCVYRI